MAVGNDPFPDMHPVAGFELGIASAGIKKPGRRDLVVMALAPGTTTAAVFTNNAFCAAPVRVAREHLAAASPRYLVTNTGNANAGTGERGMADARRTCETLAEQTGCDSSQVLPYSTGVIGEHLPMDRLLPALPAALDHVGQGSWRDAAEGIMTTDTRPKGASVRFELGGETCTLTGIAKGAGMIRPDMATMLAYIATDAAIARPQLQAMLAAAVDSSFNRITIDGDTSTNDAVTLVATGRGGAVVDSSNYDVFQEHLDGLCRQLAQAVVRDGEGATKFVTLAVAGGRDKAECLDVAYAVAQSPLVKTALFACDPNWGRILAAIGRAGVPGLDVDLVSVWLNQVLIADNGGRAAGYTEEAGQQAMAPEDILIRIHLGRGDASETVWTSDLSFDYVRINAEYRT